MRNRSVVGRKATCCNRRHGMGNRIETPHARRPIGNRANDARRQVYESDICDQLGCTRHCFFGPVGRFHSEELHTADPQQRQDRDRHGDDADTAQPLQQSTPNKHPRGSHIQRTDNGRARCGQA